MLKKVGIYITGGRYPVEKVGTGGDTIADNRVFVIGRKYEYSIKKKSHLCHNVFGAIGIIDFDTVDTMYSDVVNDALKWQELIRSSEAKMWNPLRPSNPNMYPNMKNDRDHPWSRRKKVIADYIGEITLMYYCSVEVRDYAHQRGVYRWQDLTSDTLMHKGSLCPVIMNFVRGQSDIELSAMYVSRPSDIEFYVDFEAVSDLNATFDTFPIIEGKAMIYLIGCITLNHQTGHSAYRSYMVDRLHKSCEQSIIQTWIEDMKQSISNFGDASVNVYHWGSAEKILLSKTGISLGSQFRMIDLCQEFRDASVVIQYGYGLKEIATFLHKKGIISTIWDQPIDGTQAMVDALYAEDRCRDNGHILSDEKTMTDIVKYNYVDCKVLEEIVTSIRCGVSPPHDGL